VVPLAGLSRARGTTILLTPDSSRVDKKDAPKTCSIRATEVKIYGQTVTHLVQGGSHSCWGIDMSGARKRSVPTCRVCETVQLCLSNMQQNENLYDLGTC
jgi:hypothetical protein